MGGTIKGSREAVDRDRDRDSYLFRGAWWGWQFCYFCKAVATLQRKLDRTRFVGEAISGIFRCEDHE